MPVRFPKPLEPKVTVKICGSTTLGEDFALQYLDTFSKLNRAASITTKYDTTKSGTNLNITVDADFRNVPKNQRMPDFPEEISSLRFDVDSKGTKDGFEQLLNQRCDISMASTNIAKTDYKKNGDKLAEKYIGSDAIAIIVNKSKSNTDSLNGEQLKSIFSGRDKTWTVFSRDDTSGTTRELMEYLKLNQLTGEKVKTNIEMLKKVAENENAIGYLSYSFLEYKNADVHIVPVKESAEVNLAPNPTNIIYRRCAMIRKLYFYIPSISGDKPPETKIANLLYEYATTETGQVTLRNAGFIPTSNIQDYREPPKYPLFDNINEVYDGLKDSVLYTALFTKDSNIPREKDRDDLLKWADKQSNEDPLVLIGHTDNQGSVRYNKGLSIERAEEIRTILKEKGFDVADTYGLGQQYQKDKADESRRVEIYSLSKLKEVTGVTE
ncbi:substrate-binding domain-containing protein [Iningainema tapete]|uniref:Substrate-binding domain-containing protein n=1 Tax=Iningainema tapete BLCC-T55 TaxID=2748662 RepID=A0A8J7CF38_9CYAN|nr:substrate-binding domain-containing protein [Iningainema tapete]MBD2774285.1 substrate-binding domain-containing protein [Iningainema tapete BLCC-T55]